MSKNEIKEKEEVEEVKEEVIMEKDLEETPVDVEKVSEEVEFPSIKDYNNIKKLKCNYEIFKRERDICKMKVPKKCEICNKEFKQEDNMYVAINKELKQIFICEECGTEKE